eukprot:m.85134 g.85134  ORF g.85134 m.85134 type:complete len:544 (+) comp14830_c0_seq3:354-1985(+)
MLAALKTFVVDTIGLDKRSLAAFRICLALHALIDIALVWHDIPKYYSDDGSFPRLHVMSDVHPQIWSLHHANGSPTGQYIVFTLQTMAHILFLVGYHTPVVAVINWMLIYSMQYRNFLVLQGGDVLTRQLFFWAMFLPVGDRWSLDAALSARGGTAKEVEAAEANRRKQTHSSVASLGLMLVAPIMYWFAVLQKTGVQWWDGSAVYYALHLDLFATPLAALLREEQPGIISKMFTWQTMAVERFAPVFLLLPYKPGRIVAVLVLIGMHTGFRATLNIGTFHQACYAAVIPFLPGVFWETLHRGLSNTSSIGQHWLKLLKVTPDAFLAVRRYVHLVSSVATPLFCAWAIVVSIWWNISTVSTITAPEAVQVTARSVGLEANWNMFSPMPLTADGWFVFPGKLIDGTEVDVFAGTVGPASFDKPNLVADTFSSFRERKYMVELYHSANDGQRMEYAKSLCRKWNFRDVPAESKLDSYDMYYVREDTTPTGIGKPEPLRFWTHMCFFEDEKKRLVLELELAGRLKAKRQSDTAAGSVADDTESIDN